MEAKAKQQALVLGGLLLVLSYVLVTRLIPFLSGAESAAAPVVVPRGARPAGRPGKDAVAPEDVSIGLPRLDAARSAPGELARNPFRFGDARPAAASPAPTGLRPLVKAEPPPPVVAPPVPTGPPPPPPIPFKFIGMLTVAGQGGRVAVLSDGRGVYHGREGEIVEGQYRIVRIGEESVQMEYADGRGRQTIRLSGS